MGFGPFTYVAIFYFIQWDQTYLCKFFLPHFESVHNINVDGFIVIKFKYNNNKKGNARFNTLNVEIGQKGLQRGNKLFIFAVFIRKKELHIEGLYFLSNKKFKASLQR